MKLVSQLLTLSMSFLLGEAYQIFGSLEKRNPVIVFKQYVLTDAENFRCSESS